MATPCTRATRPRQTEAALRHALGAVDALGGTIDDVVRTRLLLAPGADWQAAAGVHARLLGAVRPANTTLFVHALVGPDFLVEVEVDAIIAFPGHAGRVNRSLASARSLACSRWHSNTPEGA